jgi:hypothetical protein
MVKGTRVVPVVGSKVALRASRHATGGNNDTQKDESDDGNDFDDGKHEFGFAVASDTKEIDRNHDDPEYHNPSGWTDSGRPRPEG